MMKLKKPRKKRKKRKNLSPKNGAEVNPLPKKKMRMMYLILKLKIRTLLKNSKRMLLVKKRTKIPRKKVKTMTMSLMQLKKK